MAIWNQLTEAFMPDSKWIVNREEEDSSDNNPMSEFAEFNAAVLGIIHNEKRFPTKNEMAELSFLINPLRIENLWGNLLDLSDLSDLTGTISCDDTGISASSCNEITVVAGATSLDFKVHLNGLSDVDIQPLPRSALLSTQGCNKYNTSEKFLNEIKNYG